MSYDTKIGSAKQSISDHNSTAAPDNQISFDAFLTCLQRAGGTTEQALRSVSFEDLEACGLPRILARSIAQIFRDKEESTGGGGAVGFVSERKASVMSIPELLERYDPAEADTAVAKRLNAMARSERCIVFTEDGRVDLARSEQCIRDLKDGLPAQDTVLGSDGIPVTVRKIGERPDRFFTENPLFPGRALRSEETCDKCHKSWKGVSMEIRQLLRLALTHGEVEVDPISQVIDLIDKVSGTSTSFASIAQRFPSAAKEFSKLKQEGNLPTLRIVIGGEDGSKKRRNDPFSCGENKSY